MRLLIQFLGVSGIRKTSGPMLKGLEYIKAVRVPVVETPLIALKVESQF